MICHSRANVFSLCPSTMWRASIPISVWNKRKKDNVMYWEETNIVYKGAALNTGFAYACPRFNFLTRVEFVFGYSEFISIENYMRKEANRSGSSSQLES